MVVLRKVMPVVLLLATGSWAAIGHYRSSSRFLSVLVLDIQETIQDFPDSSQIPNACLFGRAGADSTAVIGIGSTLYILTIGQGFLLPSGEYGQLVASPSGGVMISASFGCIPVKKCTNTTQNWTWASSFHNPRLKTGSKGKKAQNVGNDARVKNKRKKRRLTGRGRNRRDESEEKAISSSTKPIAQETAGREEQPLIEETDASFFPQPSVVHILGIRHTALVTLWFEGERPIQGIYFLLKPESEIVSIVSVEPLQSIQESSSLSIGQASEDGLEVRLVSASFLGDQSMPLFNVLIESRAQGIGMIAIEKIQIATQVGTFSLPDNGIQVIIEP